jgi:transcriptional regulator with XRE-family HTH domain
LTVYAPNGSGDVKQLKGIAGCRLRIGGGKTQLYISHKTKIGQGYISDLESGRRKGTTTALKKIAGVLKVPLDLII